MPRDPQWSFVTNHARVLACIAGDPNARLKDIAASAGVTERRATQIVSDLEQAGYLTKTRQGRRNQYVVDASRKLQHTRLTNLAAPQLVMLLLEVFGQQPFG
jgi:DNA-binding MarR family transcriptional regulator